MNVTSKIPNQCNRRIELWLFFHSCGHSLGIIFLNSFSTYLFEYFHPGTRAQRIAPEWEKLRRAMIGIAACSALSYLCRFEFLHIAMAIFEQSHFDDSTKYVSSMCHWMRHKCILMWVVLTWMTRRVNADSGKIIIRHFTLVSTVRYNRRKLQYGIQFRILILIGYAR